jgi:phosphoglucomutase
MMENLRSNVPATVAGSKPVQVLDYEGLQSTNLLTGKITAIATGLGIEASNVIQLILADGSKVSARPSGTEPKIKFYVSVNSGLKSAADFGAIFQALKNKVARIQEDLGLN